MISISVYQWLDKYKNLVYYFAYLRQRTAIQLNDKCAMDSVCSLTVNTHHTGNFCKNTSIFRLLLVSSHEQKKKKHHPTAINKCTRSSVSLTFCAPFVSQQNRARGSAKNVKTTFTVHMHTVIRILFRFPLVSH